jgi:hypothetical protein
MNISQIILFSIINIFMIPPHSQASSVNSELLNTLQQGTILRMYTQDAKVDLHEVGLAEEIAILFPQTIGDGPSDAEMIVMQNPVPASQFGSVKLWTPEFDAMHTFASVRHVTNMWRNTLGLLKATYPDNPQISGVVQYWDSMPHGRLLIYPYGIEGETNAYYTRAFRQETGRATDDCELRFGYFKERHGQMIYSCRSQDIVNHEAGHYALDRMRPSFYEASNMQTGAFHEAFGDLTALHCILDDTNMSRALITSTKGNLHDPNNFAAHLAEEFGSAIGMNGYLRDLDADYKMSEVTQESHAVAEVFSGAYYDALVSAFNDAIKMRKATFQQMPIILQEIGKYSRTLLAGAVATVDTKDHDPRFSDFGRALNERADVQSKTAPSSLGDLKDLSWKKYFTEELTRREVNLADNIRPWQRLGKNAVVCKLQSPLKHKNKRNSIED